MGCLLSKRCVFIKSNQEDVSSDSQNKKQTEFRYIDGRRFHNAENVVYHLPNDEDEADRLHIQHFLIRYIWQSNFSAPVEHILSKPGAKILDIGCGAASWSFDIATTYPLCNVIGLDISPYQPTQIKPRNFEFIKANALEGLPFADNTFDFVFQRFVLVGFTIKKWPYVINEIVRVLKPGGYVELCEPSNLFDGGPATQRLLNYGEAELIKTQGGDIDVYQKLEKYLQDQEQLENIKKEMKQSYFGKKHNNLEFSKANTGNVINGLVSLKPVLTKTLQVSDEEYDELVKTCEKELLDLDIYFYMVRAYASKIIANNNNESIIQNNL
ncbi:S-adenosyl-L-methionine-dependent methyltransferase [Gigaspora margarita]|uniref:S-adenosyl-L-methionine-dependent methyltransferase n=1 Tax=Gigaspora margarita TaxID=4874 RepID=A0A8H3XFT4_GIGMA|nr:S-adenosyl-L-methionine-dependent methyltransferase [Gigaspora margarita]